MIFLARRRTAYWYIGIQMFVNTALWPYSRRLFSGKGIKVRLEPEEWKKRVFHNIHLGYGVMLGNVMGIWITGIDRWFIKFLCTVEDFAYYSFAVTMLRLINTVSSAFSIALYSYLCRRRDAEWVAGIRRKTCIVGAAMIGAVYPIQALIDWYLPEYEAAKEAVVMLFAAQYFMIIVNSIYQNLYKSMNLQKRYVHTMMAVTGIAILSNAFCGWIWGKRIVSFALATLITAMLWLIICQTDLKEYRVTYREWAYTVSILAGYFCAAKISGIIAFFIYLLWIIFVSWTVMRKELLALIDIQWLLKAE